MFWGAFNEEGKKVGGWFSLAIIGIRSFASGSGRFQGDGDPYAGALFPMDGSGEITKDPSVPAEGDPLKWLLPKAQ